MAVNPVTPPVPQNSNYARAVFIYNNPTSAIDTDQHLQSLLNFCSSNGVNVVFLDMYPNLGGANWTSQKLARMQTALNYLHLSGIRVFAYAGDVSYTYNQQWVMKNIIQPVKKYQDLASAATHRFDGFIYDVEYWTDSSQTSAQAVPQLCDLMRATRVILDMPVGCFTTFWLKDNTGTQPTLTYQGKTAQDGEFLMDNSDFVSVGAYRNHANDNGTDGPGQIAIFQPWYDYAVQAGKNLGLYCTSECMNLSPAYQTYFGKTKAQMETEHTLISQAFVPAGTLANPSNCVFLGQAVDSYLTWAAMS